MKISLLPCVLLFCVTTVGAASAHGRTAGPIGAGSPTSSDIVLAKALGIPLQRSYSKTRKGLIRLGWKPDVDPTSESDDNSYSDYPEISCGSGMDAICSARFTRSDLAIIVMVDQSKGNLPVVHMMED